MIKVIFPNKKWFVHKMIFGFIFLIVIFSGVLWASYYLKYADKKWSGEQDETTNWDIHREEAIGIELKYPPANSKVISGGPEVAKLPKGYGSGFIVVSFASPDKPEIQGGVIRVHISEKVPHEGDQISFAGQLAYISNQPEEVTGLGGESQRIIVPNYANDNWDLIIYTNYYNPTIRQILSTFKFVK